MFFVLQVMLIQPTEEMSKLIRVELNENVETRDKDLEHIKEWLKKQPHLPDSYGKKRKIINYEKKKKNDVYKNFFFTDDLRLMTFLRGCKFSLEKCKRKLDMYFTMRGAAPEFFANRDVNRPEIRELSKLM